MNINKNSLLREPMVKVLDAAIANDRLRTPILGIIERKAYRAFLGENVENSPDRTREDKFYMVRSMIHAVDKAYRNKTISDSVRKGLRCYMQNVLFESGKDIAREFEKEHGVKPPGFVTISPGKRCNLRCTGCYAGSSDVSAPALSFEVFDRIMEEKKKLWGSYFTVISGGEPLLYKSGGKDLFDIAKKHSDNFFLMYTNGTLINEDMAGRLAEVGNITPAISVEGFEKETDERRGKGVHKKILRHLQT